ncbi:uncharacterized protein LOC119672849 isoform X1 [Teleopsis dalmanni]|uniref:uncharacterized protein LOC119672405 isoform X1 n=1 Tax=Teleopsis dalmanni TaxID=139649 RepID=UPI0018CC9FE4|nr:uncharacterized protein LOC119672405 isoform X1 [Teleopsis dalmanni]XP_037939927.1 uncharacterized protein LOC119672849 isoform X1 [Teleopsis dalmanni]
MPALTTETILLQAITNANITDNPLQQRLQPETVLSPAPTVGGGVSGDDGGAGLGDTSTLSNIASIILSNFLPTNTNSNSIAAMHKPSFATFSPPSIENLVASSAEDLNNFRDVTFDIFDDDDDLFGSPMAFDASENGLWNGRFVPPPPRPPFFMDEPVLSDGLTTCDLCSWAMPTKSTFIFEGTIEKASELGWPLTLIIVSILSALLGAIIMITVVRCRRKKASNNRNGKCQKHSLKSQPTLPTPTLDHHHHQHQDYHSHQQQFLHTQTLAHPQLPLQSHHTAYSPHIAGFHQLQPHQHQQQQQQYVSNTSCSSSSLTNESNSTNHTSLSTIYRPCSSFNQHQQQNPTEQQAFHKIHNSSVKNCNKQFSQKNINMFTRPLPPQPIDPTDNSSSHSIGESIDRASCAASKVEQPAIATEVAAVMVAMHGNEKT